MINITDYLMGRIKWDDLSQEYQDNAGIIVERANRLLLLAGLSDKGCRSGFRRKEDHIRIYAEINEKRRLLGKPEIAIPWGSKHLTAAAIDIDDTDDKLKNFIKTDAGIAAMEELDLYQEDPEDTDTWVHVQFIAPASKKRVFKP